MYKTFIRPLLFRFSPERAHGLTFALLRLVQALPFGLRILAWMFRRRPAGLSRKVFGIKFPTPVGIAAGLDKDAEAFDALGALGFSFVEIGTVTPLPQPGNPSPRLFRLVADHSLINRMGFNNQGAARAAERLRKRRTDVIVGGNIGKNKVTPNDQAVSDYVKSFETLFPYVDYFAVNVSSPNTPGLRDLQQRGPLTEILSRLQSCNAAHEKRKPILLKIAPDLTDGQLDDIIEIVKETHIDGVIATNTTISREMIFATPARRVERIGAGGDPLPSRTQRRGVPHHRGRRHHDPRGCHRETGGRCLARTGVHRFYLSGAFLCPPHRPGIGRLAKERGGSSLLNKPYRGRVYLVVDPYGQGAVPSSYQFEDRINDPSSAKSVSETRQAVLSTEA